MKKGSLPLAAAAATLALALAFPLAAQEKAPAPAAPKAQAIPEAQPTTPAVAAAPKPAAPAAPSPEAQAAKLLSFVPETAAKHSGGKTVSGAELKKTATPFLVNAIKAGQAPGAEEVRTGTIQLLKTMVDKQILLAQAASDGVAATPAEIDQQLGELEKQFGQEQFNQLLAMQGLTRETAKNQLRDDLAIKKWIDTKVKADISTSAAEIQKFYTEHPDYFKTPAKISASHILLKVEKDADEKAKAAAKAKAEKLLAELKKGADFAKLAQENSDCPSKAEGGSLGFFEPDMMVPEFSAAALKLKKDELSGVVETSFGYHLIKGGERQEAGVTPLAEVKEEIKAHLDQQGAATAMDAKIAKLREAAHVEILIPDAAPAAKAAE
ncbi:MAG: peptidylprolyl isomerase [Lentisphaeria bacterium]|jgi:peptidyl-prolyl cis-trans isomerase C